MFILTGDGGGGTGLYCAGGFCLLLEDFYS